MTTLRQNEYFLVVSLSGDLLKTKSEKDFEAVKSWNNLAYAGIVKNNDYVHYLVGSTWRKKQIIRLPVSEEWEQVFYFDFNELDLSINSHIKKIQIGAKEMEQPYESL